ncbi:MAG: FAD binding domain-containing protein, partial [Candidatus Lutacidiplasmatales archaeon]
LKKMSDARVLAGGQSLVPLMKLRLVSPLNLVDLGRISGLSYIKNGKGQLLIGSMTTYNDVASSPIVNAKCNVLSEAASSVGDHQVRNRGTIGGAICQADPAGDVPAALVALGAEFKVKGPSKERLIDSSRFFVDILTTSLRKNEILVEVRVPVLPPRSAGAYVKLSRGASDLATVGVAAVMTLDKAGACEDARLQVDSWESVTLAAVRPAPDSLESVISRTSRSFAAPVVTASAPPNQLVAVHPATQDAWGSASKAGGAGPRKCPGLPTPINGRACPSAGGLKGGATEEGEVPVEAVGPLTVIVNAGLDKAAVGLPAGIGPTNIGNEPADEVDLEAMVPTEASVEAPSMTRETMRTGQTARKCRGRVCSLPTCR